MMTNPSPKSRFTGHLDSRDTIQPLKPLTIHAERCDFFASTSRDKKFVLRAASSLESTTREQRALLIFSA